MDGQGKTISAGGISEAIKAIQQAGQAESNRNTAIAAMPSSRGLTSWTKSWPRSRI